MLLRRLETRWRVERATAECELGRQTTTDSRTKTMQLEEVLKE